MPISLKKSENIDVSVQKPARIEEPVEEDDKIYSLHLKSIKYSIGYICMGRLAKPCKIRKFRAEDMKIDLKNINYSMSVRQARSYCFKNRNLNIDEAILMSNYSVDKVFSAEQEIVLPALSHQYTIKVNGKVEMGDQVSNILQVLYNTFLNGPKPPYRMHKTEIGQESNIKENKEAPLIHEIMSKNEITHLYGKHKKDKFKKNNIQV